MKKIFFLGLMILILCLWSIMSFSADKGKVLWPQITDAIYNENGDMVMKLEIGSDGLTVTDKCWDSYMPEGCAKRWNIDMQQYIDAPLKNYKFDKAWAGLPVTITIEIYKTDNYWTTVETYQEILILGGKQTTLEFPKWFSIPKDRLAYDFDENPAWPRDWTLPKGKLAIFQGCAKVLQKDIDGVNPWLRFGFTHIYPHAFSKGADHHTPDREHTGGLFYDNEWIDNQGDASNPIHWKVGPFLDHASQGNIEMPDFEWPNWTSWGDSQYEAFKGIIDQVYEKYPDEQIGCWGIGPLDTSFRIFDDFDENNHPSGVVNEGAALKWRNLYKDPSQKRNAVYSRCGLNLGNPSMYYINNAKPSQLYNYLQEYECGKLLYPNHNNVLSTWIQVEFVDNYPLSSYLFKDSKGNDRVAYLKHQVPASQVYALSLFGHCVMDGLHCWDIGTYYTENPDDWCCFEKNEQTKKIVANGEEVNCNYYCKYFGFYNYHVLGMWQASQNKDIIEAETKWFMPEYKSSKNDIWREGDEVFPSFASLHKEPLIRAKMSGDGKELLVIADNPWNTELEHVTVRVDGKPYKFDLVGDWPQIKRFKVSKK